jgi:hypothetical protein
MKNEMFFYPEQEEVSQDPSDYKNLETENPRLHMKILGNKLVEVTDTMINKSKPFLRNLNRGLNGVKIDLLIFQEADYIDICVKEVEEVNSILAGYEIYLNFLENKGIVN